MRFHPPKKGVTGAYYTTVKQDKKKEKPHAKK